MSTYIVYHNPRCSKSRLALQHLDATNKHYTVIEYLKEIPTRDELASILSKLGIPATELLRKGEAIFNEKYKGKELTEEAWIDAMIEHPKLIERPIVILGDKAVIARPTERIEELL